MNQLLNLIALILTSMQGLCVLIPCIFMESILIVALIECHNKKDLEGIKIMITFMKVVAITPLLWLMLVLVIGLA